MKHELAVAMQSFFNDRVNHRLLIGLNPICDVTAQLLDDDLRCGPVELKDAQDMSVLAATTFQLIHNPVKRVHIDHDGYLVISILLVTHSSALTGSIWADGLLRLFRLKSWLCIPGSEASPATGQGTDPPPPPSNAHLGCLRA